MSHPNGTEQHDDDPTRDTERSWMVAVAAVLLIVVIAVLAVAT